jgi:hypothetical protein
MARMPQDSPSRDAQKYILRFEDEGMRERLHEVARAAGRSLNAELNHRLRQSFEAGDTAALRQELEHLRTLADERGVGQRISASMAEAFAVMARRAIEQLPPEKVKKSRELRNDLEFLNAYLHPDPEQGLFGYLEKAAGEAVRDARAAMKTAKQR